MYKYKNQFNFLRLKNGFEKNWKPPQTTTTTRNMILDWDDVRFSISPLWIHFVSDG